MTCNEQLRLVPVTQGWFAIKEFINKILHINIFREKLYDYFQDFKNASDKTEYPYLLKTLKKTGIDRHFLNMI